MIWCKTGMVMDSGVREAFCFEQSKLSILPDVLYDPPLWRVSDIAHLAG
jgi:hypothetical protein